MKKQFLVTVMSLGLIFGQFNLNGMSHLRFYATATAELSVLSACTAFMLIPKLKEIAKEKLGKNGALALKIAAPTLAVLAVAMGGLTLTSYFDTDEEYGNEWDCAVGLVEKAREAFGLNSEEVEKAREAFGLNNEEQEIAKFTFDENSGFTENQQSNIRTYLKKTPDYSTVQFVFALFKQNLKNKKTLIKYLQSLRISKCHEAPQWQGLMKAAGIKEADLD
ncbi:hypothetical protein ACFLY6_02570 [Candidatus Dependentiae bacterium]